jgi:transcriptional regulator with GAF, ATPase, and Fis domain
VNLCVFSGEKLDNQSNKRALRTINKLNAIRHKQAQKIDILCNDMVLAGKDVINQINLLTFTVDFYESIAGQTDISILLDKAARQVREFVQDCNVAIFLTNTNGFELHMADDNPIEFDCSKIESYFTEEVVNEICRSNNICSMEDMCEVGLQGNPNVLGKLSAAAVPLGRFSEPIGFILICRSINNKLTANELNKVATITPGLRNAINGCHTLMPEILGD